MIKVLLLILNLLGGGIIGWFLVYFDYVAYIYILHPEAQISQYLKWQLGKREFKGFLETLKRRQVEFDKLTTRGILFQVAWLVLAIFTVTSVPSWFGRALVMVLGIRILLEEWRDWLKNKDVLRQRLFWQIKKEWQNQELKLYLIGKTIAVAWLCLLLVQ